MVRRIIAVVLLIAAIVLVSYCIFTANQVTIGGTA